MYMEQAMLERYNTLGPVSYALRVSQRLFEIDSKTHHREKRLLPVSSVLPLDTPGPCLCHDPGNHFEEDNESL